MGQRWIGCPCFWFASISDVNLLWLDSFEVESPIAESDLVTQRAPVWRHFARSSMMPRYLSMSSLATFDLFSPCCASGSKWSRISDAALQLCPSIHWK